MRILQRRDHSGDAQLNRAIERANLRSCAYALAWDSLSPLLTPERAREALGEDAIGKLRADMRAAAKPIEGCNEVVDDVCSGIEQVYAALANEGDFDSVKFAVFDDLDRPGEYYISSILSLAQAADEGER